MHRDRIRGEDYDYERLLKRHKEERMRGDTYETRRDPRYEEEPQQSYTSICLNGLNQSVPLLILKDEIYKQFNKFGDLNVRVVNTNPLNRIAFVNFFEPAVAKEAKHARKNLVLFDHPVHIEAVYNSRYKGGHSPNGHVKPGYAPTSSVRSPTYDSFEYRGSNVSDRGSIVNERGSNINERSSNVGERGSNVGERGSNVGERGSNVGERSNNLNERGSNSNVNEHHKFPFHLNHVQPEDDPYSNRTLFVGNMDVEITEADVRSIFDRYGVIEEIDIKRPMHGQGNAYAFIKYYNVDMAHRAKVDMSGRFIGNYQCKIGYGKPTATNCLWVGGLGPWVRPEVLEQEFDRFGVINRIEWPHGKGYAYVLFDSVDAAVAANTEMRGVALGGPEKRIRVDYADESHMPSQSKSPRPAASLDGDKKSTRSYREEGKPREEYKARERVARFDREYIGGELKGPEMAENDKYRKDDNDRNSVGSERRRHSGKYDPERSYRNNQPHERVRSSREKDLDRERGSPHLKRRRTASPISNRDEKEQRTSESDQKERNRTISADSGVLVNVDQASNIEELSKALHVVWNGVLVLKNSAFAARMHLVSGDVHLVDTLMRDVSSTELPMLKITQRLRLDPPKLEEVGRRVQTSGPNGHAVLLAMPGSPDTLDESNNSSSSSSVQQRPLRNLVSYLKQKEAAGVISLPPSPSKDKDNIGVLHAFPPCSFGNDFLLKCSPELNADLTKDDHLVIMVVRGAV